MAITHSYQDFSDFLKKLDNHTNQEAKKWFETGRKMKLGKTLWRATGCFFRSYVGEKGYKDGVMGLFIAVFTGFYQILSYAKYWEMRKTESGKWKVESGKDQNSSGRSISSNPLSTFHPPLSREGF